jgi:hypothetical protein
MKRGAEPIPLHPNSEQAAAFQYEIIGEQLEAPPKRWLVNGILGLGDVGALYGEPATGKSALAVHLCHAVATGNTWFGKKTNAGAVLYLALERKDVTSRRCQALFGSSNPSSFHVAIANPFLDLARGEDAASVVQTAKQVAAQTGRPVRLIVLDTLSRAIAGHDENSAGTISLVAASLTRIASETGATVLVLHHETKARRNLRGSSALLGAVDTAVRVSKSRQHLTATIEKANDAAEGVALRFGLVPVEQGFDRDTGEPVTTVIVEPAECAPTKQTCGFPTPRAAAVLALIREFCRDGEGLSRERLLAAARHRGVVTTNLESGAELLRKALKELEKRQLVSRGPKDVSLLPPKANPPP